MGVAVRSGELATVAGLLIGTCCFHGEHRHEASTDLGLFGSAWVALAREEPVAAARLLGATWAIHERFGTLEPWVSARLPEVEAALRSRLLADTFAATFAAGRTLPSAEAIAETRELAETEPAVADASPAHPIERFGLSPREPEVPRLVVAGRSSPEIAAALFISRRTTATHVGDVVAKLGVASRA
jgi:DNA-binding CsgD family transcriptional regulator